jgi:hypothetical protein
MCGAILPRPFCKYLFESNVRKVEMKVTPNEALVGKKITLLDGSRDTITETTKTGYKLQGRRKGVAANCVVRDGQKFEEIDQPVDGAKVGSGYVTLPKVKKAPAKADKKAPAKAPAKADKKPAGKKVAETKPARKSATKVVEELEEVDAITIENVTEQSGEIRSAVEEILREHLPKRFDNFVSVNTGAQIEEEGGDPTVILCMSDLTFDIPEEEEELEEELEELEEEEEAVEFNFSEETLSLVEEGLWESQVAANSKVAQRVFAALQLDEEEMEEFVIGSRLVDEDGKTYYFAGMQRDPVRLILEDENGEPKDVGSKDFESLDFVPFSEEEETEVDELEEEEVDELDELDEAEEEEEESEDDSNLLEGCESAEEAADALADYSESEIRTFIFGAVDLGEEGSEDYEATVDYIEGLDKEELIEYVVSLFFEETDEEEEEEEVEEGITAEEINEIRDFDSLLEIAKQYSDKVGKVSQNIRHFRKIKALKALLIEKLVDAEETTGEEDFEFESE